MNKAMLKNYFKVAFRNFYRNKGNSFINVFGLSVALLCVIIIFLFVKNELTYDAFHTHADQIYRLTVQEINRPGARHFATSSPPMGPALVQSFPEIEQAVRFRFTDSNILSNGDRQFYEYNVVYADSSFLTMFDFPLSSGDPKTALTNVNSVILTQEMAGKYFGEENPVGESLLLDNQTTLTVTGVFDQIPNNTHFNFDFIISFDSFQVPFGYPVTLESWGWVSFYTYVKLSDYADPTAMEEGFPEFLRTHMGEEADQNRILHLQPLKDIYLSPDLLNAGVDMLVGNKEYILGLSAIAIFLLLIACFNYMNLSTAQAIRRSKEVGVRKTLGAGRKTLIWQFLFESFLLSLLSIIIALVFLDPTLKMVSSIFSIRLILSPSDYWLLIPFFVTLSFAVGLAAGFYPSFMMSRFHPSKALKGYIDKKHSAFDLQKILVVLQFTIAVVLISGSLIIRDQVQYMQQKDLGFGEEQVVALHMDGSQLTQRYRTIKNHLLQNRDVVNITMGGGLLDGRNGSVPIYPSGDDPEGYPMNIYGVHFDYFEVMGINIIEGRGFDESFQTDSSDGIVINQSAAEVFGWDDPLGKELQVGEIMDGYVIGVTDDFHFASLHREIEPLVMYIPPTNMENLFIRIRPGNTAQILASLEKSWNEVVPDFPFSLVFLDDHLNRLYQNDQLFFRLLTIFTILTVLVACMGLYGLTSYSIQQRSKEIGIRKILGAKVTQIAWLLSSHFVILISLGFLVSIPVSWLIMNNWLQEFAYRIAIPWWVFVAAGLMALIIAMGTISYQTIRAATLNPVETLRSE